MSKQKLIDFINSLPDNLDYFKTEENNLDYIDLKIFTKPKSKEFYKEYFGI